MTLFEIIDIFKKTALVQPNIRSASDGSVYDKLNTNPSIQYDVFHIQQTTHQEDFETDYYGLQLFYISRLEDSLEDNRLQIQSIGKEILGNIIRTFCENFGIDYPTITYTPFTQRFNDLTAGVYCNVRLEVPKDLICADDYIAEVVPGKEIKLQDMGITITQNGLIVITPDAEYDGIGEIRIETNVPQYPAELQYKEVEYTENGEYVVRPDQDYDGLTEVAVSVDVPDRYDEGYDDGKEDGIAEQKGKLTATTFTENNTYTIENGWSAVTVDVPDRYDDGKADGIAEQKAKLVPTAVTENGIYSRADGYSSFEVNVPATEDRYDEGYADGEAAQKAKLTSLSVSANGEYNREDGYSAITVNVPSDYQEGYDDGFDDGEATQKAKLTTLSVSANGEYTRADGYSAITVNVPQTGSSNEDLIANLQGDYFLIPEGTTHLRNYALYGACFSSITIPTSVTGIGVSAFTRNTCLTGITIPDTVTKLGTNDMQVVGGSFAQCSALKEIHIGSGVTLLPSSTFANCSQLEDITIPSGITGIGTSCFNGCSAMTAMTFEGVTPPTLRSNTSSLGSTAYTFPIYVPCQSLNAYKTAFGEYYAPRIQCRGSEIITALTLNVSSAITDSATATTTYSPSTAYTDIYYTSSDPTVATIDSGTGVITVVSEGNTTICAIDRISGLQDCKTVNVITPTPSGALMIKYRVTSTTEPTQVTSKAKIDDFAYYAIYDGKAYDTSSKYITFPDTGDLWVYYVLKDPTTCPATAFMGLYDGTIIPITVVEARLPDTITYVGTYSFYFQSNLSAVTLGNSVQRMGRFAFTHCTSLQSINIPLSYTGNTSMDTVNGDIQIFGGSTGNVNVYYEGNTTDWVTRISFKGYGSNPLFQGGKLYVNSTGFSGSPITNLTIPSNLTEISDFAFDGCGSITSITIHTGVTRLGYACFRECSNLTGVTDNRTTPQTLATDYVGCLVGTDNILQFAKRDNPYPIYVPASAVETYKTATGWSRKYVDRITAITS